MQIESLVIERLELTERYLLKFSLLLRRVAKSSGMRGRYDIAKNSNGVFGYLNPHGICNLFDGSLELVLIHAITHALLRLAENLSESFPSALNVTPEHFKNFRQ